MKGHLTSRRQDIDRAKGLAILLVVFGHIVARTDPLQVHWYEPLRRAVYAFHMPFFLYLSGIVVVFSGALFAPPEKWRQMLTLRARRLLIPFFALGMIIVIGKCLAAHVVFVDNQPASLWAGIGSLIWHTGDSPALSIWYLFVLFVLSILAPIIVWADHGRLNALVILSFLLYFIPMPEFLYLDHIGKYAIFFAMGAWAATRDEKWTAFIDSYWRILLVSLLCALVVVAVFGATWPDKLALLPVGALSMPALHGLVRHVYGSLASVFLWLGQNSFIIYLFNTIFIGLSKGLLLRITDWNGDHFVFFAVFLMLAGSFGPILLRETLFRRVDLLDRYTR